MLATVVCQTPTSGQFPGIRRYGSPTLGCAGASSITASSAPVVGNSTFAVGCTGALPFAIGILALSAAEQDPPIVFRSAYLWISPSLAITLPVTMTSAGLSSVPLPIPRSTPLLGGTMFAQFLWADTGPSCTGNVLAGTDALAITIQCPPDPGEPNNSAGQATPISPGAPIARILCPSGDEDWFQLSVASHASLSAQMAPPVGRNYDLQLRSGTTVLATSASSGSTPESVSACVGPGTYYLRVYGAAGAFDPFATYSLTSAVRASSGTVTYTSPNEVTLRNNQYHPTFDIREVQSSTGCRERISITITGSVSRFSCSGGATLDLNYNPQGQFPVRIGGVVLTSGGTFTISGSFFAERNVIYDFGLLVWQMGSNCTATFPAGAQMTVTRS